MTIHPTDYLLPEVHLDHLSMEEHQFVWKPEPLQPPRYILVFSEKTCDIIPLPAPSLFNYHARNGYTIMPPDIIAYRNELAEAEAATQAWGAQVPQPNYFPPGPDGFYGW